MRILDSYWYTPMASQKVIGIVKTLDDHKGIQFFIGTSGNRGATQKQDEEHIASYGAKFYPDAMTNFFIASA